MSVKMSDLLNLDLPSGLQNINFTAEQLTAMQGVPAETYTSIQGGVSTGGGNLEIQTISDQFTANQTKTFTLAEPVSSLDKSVIIAAKVPETNSLFGVTSTNSYIDSIDTAYDDSITISNYTVTLGTSNWDVSDVGKYLITSNGSAKIIKVLNNIAYLDTSLGSNTYISGDWNLFLFSINSNSFELKSTDTYNTNYINPDDQSFLPFINDATINYNQSPQFAIDSFGNIHAVWSAIGIDSMYLQIRYAKFDGTSWSASTNINGRDNTVARYDQYGPQIKIDSNNIIHVIWFGLGTDSITTSRIRYAKSDGTGWTASININNGDTILTNYPQNNPQFVIDSNNNLHAVWHGTGTDSTSRARIRYAKFNGASWSVNTNINVDDTVTTTTYDQSTSQIAIDSNNNLHVVWQGTGTDQTTYSRIRYAKFNGTSWSASTNINAGDTIIASVGQTNPQIAIDSSNNPHVVWNGYGTDSASQNRIRYAKFNGTSWSVSTNINTGDTVTTTTYGQFLPCMKIDSSNNIHIIWTGNGTNGSQQIRYAKFNGTSWSVSTNINIIDAHLYASPQYAPQLVVGSNNILHVVWTGGGTDSTQPKIRYAKFNGISWLASTSIIDYVLCGNIKPGTISLIKDKDNNIHFVYSAITTKFSTVSQIFYTKYDGYTWSIPISIHGSSGDTFITTTHAQSLPHLAVDSNNNLHVVWSGPRTNNSYKRIHYAKFNGTSWSIGTNINNGDTALNNYDQINPKISIDSSNNLHVVWQGLGTDSTNRTRIRYAKFNGTSWSTSTNINTGDTVTTIDYDQALPQIAVDSTNNLHVVWQGSGTDSLAQTKIRYAKFNGTSWSTSTNLTANSVYLTYVQTAPQIAIDSNNIIHVVWSGLGSDNASKARIRYTAFNGVNWSTNTNINLGDSNIIPTTTQLSPQLVIDSKNNVHVVWQGDRLRHSKFNGSVWSMSAACNNMTTTLPSLTTTAFSIVITNTNLSIISANAQYTLFNTVGLDTHFDTTFTYPIYDALSQTNVHIAKDSFGNLHAVWHGAGAENTITRIRYSKFSVVSQLWSPSISLHESTNDTVVPITSYQYNPQIAVDSNNNLHVVWHGTGSDSLNNRIRYAKFNGTSWSTSTNVNSGDTVTTTSYDQSSPHIAIDSSNNLHVVWQGQGTDSTSNSKIRYAKFNGTSWSTSTNINTGDTVITTTYTQYVPQIVVDSNNNLHVVWHGTGTDSTTQTRIRYAKFDGTSWSVNTNVNSGDTVTNVSQYNPKIVVDTTNNLHVIWYGSGTDFSFSRIRYAKFDGTTWSKSANINAGDSVLVTNFTQTTPQIAIDSSNNLYVTWAGSGTDDSYNKIRYAKFDGTTWSKSTNINTGDDNITQTQASPCISVSSNNNIHVVWHGPGIDNANSRLRHSIYNTSWSTSRSLSFRDNRITNKTIITNFDCVRDSNNNIHVVYITMNQLFYTKFDGYKWSIPVNIHTNSKDTVVTLAYAQSNIHLVIDSNDNLHAVWQGLGTDNTSQPRIRYAKFNGTSWSKSTNINIGDTNINVGNPQTAPRIAIDSSNNPHVVWAGTGSDFSQSKIRYAKFNGTSWSASANVNVGDVIIGTHTQITPQIAIDKTNNVHVVWSGAGTDNASQNRIRYAKFNGTSWSASTNITTQSVLLTYTQTNPQIAIDSSNNPHVVWQGYGTDSTSKEKIRYVKFDGSSWISFTTFESYRFDLGTTQSLPKILIDATDKIYITWLGAFKSVLNATAITSVKTVYSIYSDGKWSDPLFAINKYNMYICSLNELLLTKNGVEVFSLDDAVIYRNKLTPSITKTYDVNTEVPIKFTLVNSENWTQFNSMSNSSLSNSQTLLYIYTPDDVSYYITNGTVARRILVVVSPTEYQKNTNTTFGSETLVTTTATTLMSALTETAQIATNQMTNLSGVTSSTSMFTPSKPFSIVCVLKSSNSTSSPTIQNLNVKYNQFSKYKLATNASYKFIDASTLQVTSANAGDYRISYIK